MEKKDSTARDIAIIASRLEDKMEIHSITFDQILPCEHGENMNGLTFVKSERGLYFYTLQHSLEMIMDLKKVELPVLVCYSDSRRLFRIK